MDTFYTHKKSYAIIRERIMEEKEVAVKSVNAKKIIETSLKLAQLKSWRSLRLFEIAQAMNISLLDIKKHFKNKDEIAQAWFDEATKEMLSKANDPDFTHLTVHERLHFLIISWLTALMPYQRIAREIVYNKLHPQHVTGKITALKSIHRTVDWLLEAVQADVSKTKRRISEAGLSTVFASTFLYWLHDYSNNFEDTRRFLTKELTAMETVAYFTQAWIFNPLARIKNTF